MYRAIVSLLADKGAELIDSLELVATLLVFSYLIKWAVGEASWTMPFRFDFLIILSIIYVVFVYTGTLVELDIPYNSGEAFELSYLDIYFNNSIELLKIIAGVYTVVYPMYYFSINALVMGNTIKRTLVSLRLSSKLGVGESVRRSILLSIPIIAGELMLLGVMAGLAVYYSNAFIFYGSAIPVFTMLKWYLLSQPILLALAYLETFYVRSVA